MGEWTKHSQWWVLSLPNGCGADVKRDGKEFLWCVFDEENRVRNRGECSALSAAKEEALLALGDYLEQRIAADQQALAVVRAGAERGGKP